MEASLPPFSASMPSCLQKELPAPRMTPKPVRSSPISVDIPSTVYKPRSGPPLAPISLLPVQDTTGYITDRRLMPSPGLAKDGKPLPPVLTYIVRWTDAPAARNLVPVKEILDYVSPWAVEEFERAFEAELDGQRRQKEREKEERRALRAAEAVAAAAAAAVGGAAPAKGKEGKKKRGRPPVHKVNDIAPITAEEEEEDIAHKKFPPGSMTLSTPKKSKTMDLDLDIVEESGDGAETPLDYATDGYDELAGEPIYDLLEQGEVEGHQRAKVLSTMHRPGDAQGSGDVEDDGESDSGDVENYLDVEVRNLESMSYEQTPLHETASEILMSVEEADYASQLLSASMRQPSRDLLSAKPDSRTIESLDEAVIPGFPLDGAQSDVFGDSRQKAAAQEEMQSLHGISFDQQQSPRKRAEDELIQGAPRPKSEILSREREKEIQEGEMRLFEGTGPAYIKGKQQLNRKKDEVPRRECPKTENFKTAFTRTPVPLPVILGMKKVVTVKQTPVPLPAIPGLRQTSARSLDTVASPTTTQRVSTLPSLPLSRPTLPSLRPSSDYGWQPVFPRHVHETPVLPPKVPTQSAQSSSQPHVSMTKPVISPSRTTLPASSRVLSAAKLEPEQEWTSHSNKSEGIIYQPPMSPARREEETREISQGNRVENVESTSSLQRANSPLETKPRKRKRASTRGAVPIREDDDGEPVWEVKLVIDHKDWLDDDDELIGREYLVVWEGDWPLTWEVEENFLDGSPLDHYWSRRPGRRKTLFAKYMPGGKMVGKSPGQLNRAQVKLEADDSGSFESPKIKKQKSDKEGSQERRRSLRMRNTPKDRTSESASGDELFQDDAGEENIVVKLDPASETGEEQGVTKEQIALNEADPASLEHPSQTGFSLNPAKAISAAWGTIMRGARN